MRGSGWQTCRRYRRHLILDQRQPLQKVRPTRTDMALSRTGINHGRKYQILILRRCAVTQVMVLGRVPNTDSALTAYS